jgi:hypothetical protein
MSKWADFCIKAKRMNNRGTHIDCVKTLPDLGDKFGAEVEKSRAQVVQDLKIGVSYITIVKSPENKWDKGQKVIIDRVNGVDYIKTLPDKSEADNLDNLPNF